MTSAIGDEEWVLDILRKTSAIQRGHIELQSDYHSDTYIHARYPLSKRKYAKEAGRRLANRFSREGINVVVGITSGGDYLGSRIAKFLKADFVSLGITGGKIELPKNHPIKDTSNVLIVDDVIRAPEGKQMKDTLNLIKSETKGKVSGIGVMVSRVKDTKFDVKTECLALFTDSQVWLAGAKNCPYCKGGIPLSPLKQLAEEELTKNQIEDYSTSIHDLLGKPSQEKVAILGSYDHFILMDHIAKIVVKQGRYAWTSRQVYVKNSPDLAPLTIPQDIHAQEGMNKFLIRLISNTSCAIVIYAGAGGQFIETAWCSQHNIPALGILPLRPPAFLDIDACEFLTYSSSHNLFFCNRVSSGGEATKQRGGWFCEQRKRCPFPEAGLSKMILDYYTTSRNMFLVGADNFESFEKPINVFVRKLRLSDNDLA